MNYSSVFNNDYRLIKTKAQQPRLSGPFVCPLVQDSLEEEFSSQVGSAVTEILTDKALCHYDRSTFKMTNVIIEIQVNKSTNPTWPIPKQIMVAYFNDSEREGDIVVVDCGFYSNSGNRIVWPGMQLMATFIFH